MLGNDPKKAQIIAWLAHNFTAEKLRAITTEGANILLAAGAGCGKTTALSMRVLYQVMALNVSLAEMVILTFTENAAREMQERIKAVLLETAEKAQTECPFLDDNLRERLRRQAAIAPTTAITTFDAFANNLVRKYAPKVGVANTFTVLDENINAYIFSQELNREIARRFSADDKPLQTFLDRQRHIDGHYLRHAVTDVENFRARLADADEFYRSGQSRVANEGQMAAAYQTALTDFTMRLNAIGRALQRFIDLYGDGANTPDGQPFLTAFRAQLTKILGRVGKEKASADLEDLAIALQSLTFNGKNNQPDDIVRPEGFTWYHKAYGGEENETRDERYQAIRGAFLKVKDQVGALLPRAVALKVQQNQSADINYLLALNEVVHERALAYKKAHNAYSFNDIQNLALRLLRENIDVREAERSRCRALLIDEYQDSNDLQEEFLRILDTDEAPWQKYRVTHDEQYCFNRNVLFMVGDVKQSIYRFRNAVPDLFVAKYTQSDKYHCQVIAMSDNYRSTDAVITQVNELFGQVMTPIIGGVDYNDGRQALIRAQKAFDGVKVDEIRPLSSLYLDDNECREKGLTKLTLKRVAQAKIVADYIAKAVASDSPVWLNRRGKKSHPTYGSFAVLGRTKAETQAFCQALAEKKIPFLLDINKDLSQEDVVLSLKSLLRLTWLSTKKAPLNAREKAWYKHSLASVERSFLLNVNDAQIVEDLNGKNNETPRAVALIKETLKATDEGHWTLANIYQKLVRTFNIYARIATLNAPDDALASYAWFGACIDNLATLGFTLEDAVAFFYGSNGNGEIKNETKLYRVKTDAVTITTIHKAKGLEYDFVILPANSERSRGSLEPHKAVYGDEKSGLFTTLTLTDEKIINEALPLKPASLDDWSHTDQASPYLYPPLFAYQVKESWANDSEILRLLYVALTRAHFLNLILLPSNIDRLRDKLLFGCQPPATFLDFLALGLNRAWLTKASLSAFTAQELEQETKRKFTTGLGESTTPLPNIVFHPPLDPEKWVKNPRDYRASKLNAGLPDNKAKDFGNRLHKELSLLDWSHLPVLPATDFIANAYERSLIEKFIHSDLLKKVQAHKPTYYQELTYLDPRTKREGSLDLALVWPDGGYIIDYKTKHLSDESYLRQLAIYRRNLAQLFNLPETQIKTFLYSLVDGNYQEVFPKNNPEATAANPLIDDPVK